VDDPFIEQRPMCWWEEDGYFFVDPGQGDQEFIMSRLEDPSTPVVLLEDHVEVRGTHGTWRYPIIRRVDETVYCGSPRSS
jgi:hypothetical protein